MTREPFTDEERALRDRMGFADPPPPRRTDAAFARSVADAARGRRPLAARFVGGAALAGALAVAVIAVARTEPPPAVVIGPPIVAVAADVVDDADDFDLVDTDDAPSFAALDADDLNDATLLAFNTALDRALARQE